MPSAPGAEARSAPRRSPGWKRPGQSAVFDAKSTTLRERKQLLRLLLVEVMVAVDLEARRAELWPCWEGGTMTRTTVALPRLGAPWRKTD
jgi:hypothetical protein